MEQKCVARWVWLLVAILVAVVLVRMGFVLMIPLPHGPAARSVGATRALAAAYLLCDVAVSTSLITLLVINDRRAPAWVEPRLPFRGRWLWHLLLGLTILSYLSLAPTFLFFLIRMTVRK